MNPVWRTYVVTQRCPICGRAFVITDFDPTRPGLRPIAFRAGVAHEGCVSDVAYERARDIAADDD